MTQGRHASTEGIPSVILTHPPVVRTHRVDTPVDPVAVLEAVSHRAFPALVRHGGATVVAADPDRVVRDVRVWEALGAPPQPREPGLSMVGGWIAMLAYDLAGSLERLPVPVAYPGGPPRALAARYPTVVVIDDDGRCTVATTGSPAHLHDWVAMVAGARPPAPLTAPAPRAVTTSLPGDAYLEAVEEARAFIRAGDCYQVNLAQRLEVAWPDGPVAFARRLWGVAGPTAHRAYLAMPEGAAVSASPELLVSVRDGVARTAPIKGTAPPGGWRTLSHSAKDRAEHVMIVDLMRNDLGRRAVAGGVRVERLFQRLATPYVEHMVSEIAADLPAATRAVDVLRAVFPGGSVTGCPKVRSMEIIRRLEPVARGPAYGSLIALGADDALEANVAIRTAWLAGPTAHYWCGGAVVWDSDAAGERTEAWRKAAPFLAATGARAPH